MTWDALTVAGLKELDESAQWRVGCEEAVRDDWDEGTCEEVLSVSTELSEAERSVGGFVEGGSSTDTTDAGCARMGVIGKTPGVIGKTS